jgi:hypothetical protein
LRELDRDTGGAGGDVENAAGRGRYDLIDHRPTPPAVLSEREELGQRVVPPWETPEELTGEPVGICLRPQGHGIPLAGCTRQ